MSRSTCPPGFENEFREATPFIDDFSTAIDESGIKVEAFNAKFKKTGIEMEEIRTGRRLSRHLG